MLIRPPCYLSTNLKINVIIPGILRIQDCPSAPWVNTLCIANAAPGFVAVTNVVAAHFSVLCYGSLPDLL